MPTTKWTAQDIPDLTGKTVIVTGANSGLGYETARALARKNAHVVLAVRSQERGEAAIKQILQELPTALLEFMPLDLSNLASISQFAETFKATHSQLDILANNAGIMDIPYQKTADGFEMQFGTNHLGHFALTGLLLPVIEATPNARVVNVSSFLHILGKLNFDNLQSEKKYSPYGAYGASKLANLLFTYELQRKFAQAGIKAISVASHPGYAATNLQLVRAKMQQASFKVRFISKQNELFGQSAAMGALPTLYAATAPEVHGGEYIGPGGFLHMRGYPKEVHSKKMSHDQALARKLWQVSEDLTGVNYDSLVPQPQQVS